MYLRLIWLVIVTYTYMEVYLMVYLRSIYNVMSGIDIYYINLY